MTPPPSTPPTTIPWPINAARDADNRAHSAITDSINCTHASCHPFRAAARTPAAATIPPAGIASDASNSTTSAEPMTIQVN
ncbi:hypothetical protein AB0H42_12705 [Nocardia sp. NPDC050799]|uniref:hypothetical protein n=1 Tax=Nocardia sp. NPDC050799 TaxID=3154842 RepID=UPI0033FCAD1D